MTLADYTTAALCLPDVAGRDAASVLLELSRALARAQVVPASLSLFNVALLRHFLAQDDQTGAVAYSAGCLPSVARTTLAVARLRQPCSWQVGAPPARLVFLVATPPGGVAAVASLLDPLRRLVEDGPIVRAMHAARGGAEMFATLGRITVVDCGPVITAAGA